MACRGRFHVSPAAAAGDDAGPADERAAPAAGMEPEQGSGLEVYGDSAYGSGQARADYRDGGHGTFIKPGPLRPAVPGGFTIDDFTVDEEQGTVTCPNGVTRPVSGNRTVTFGAACAGCPLRARCTTAKDGRSMTIRPHEDLLRDARAQARTPQFKRATRPGRTSSERSPGPHPERPPDQAPLHRHGQEQRLAAHPVRRAEPAHPGQRRPDPLRRGLGPGLTGPGSPSAGFSGPVAKARKALSRPQGGAHHENRPEPGPVAAMSGPHSEQRLPVDKPCSDPS
jgi:Transposase DDE domain